MTDERQKLSEVFTEAIKILPTKANALGNVYPAAMNESLMAAVQGDAMLLSRSKDLLALVIQADGFSEPHRSLTSDISTPLSLAKGVEYMKKAGELSKKQ